MNSLEEIYIKLHLNRNNGLIIYDELKSNQELPDRILRILTNFIRPDAIFCVANKPFILFFEKPNLSSKNVLLKQIWNFNESPIVIIVDESAVEIYNGFNFIKSASSLEKLGDQEILDDFEYYKLISGYTWNKYQKHLNSHNRIDFKLLTNIRFAQQEITKYLKNDNNGELANALIGKIIYIRYLIDRKVNINFNNISKINNSYLCELLKDKYKIKELFDHLESKFNGELFRFNDAEYDAIDDKCFDVLLTLLSGDDMPTKQQSLFDIYDFSIIPIEFISNIYELFIGENNQKSSGAYYTPLFLVDYILSQTITPKLKIEHGYDCKVLDPACGSGVFLVEALRKIIENYKSLHPDYDISQNLSMMVSENIFGIDRDKLAIDVAIFSIYLTLLDYQEPSDIEKFRFPNLLNKNLFIADYFDEDAIFNKILKPLELDFILGNPPWGTSDETNEIYLQYIKNKNLNISNSEIAQAFLLRNLDFVQNNTTCAMVVTSKIFYNINGASFRQHILKKFEIKQILELSVMREYIFNNPEGSTKSRAQAPAAVIIYKKSDESMVSHNVINCISLKPSKLFLLFQILVIQKNDIKNIPQKLFIEYDFLWKISFTGSFIDFNLIKRLKHYDSIFDVIQKNQYLNGKGIQRVCRSTKNPMNADVILGKRFINTAKGVMSQFKVEGSDEVWEDRFVHRLRNIRLYEGPLLLIKKGFRQKDFKIVATMYYGDAVYTDSLTGVKPLHTIKKTVVDDHADIVADINILKIMAGILNSRLVAYLNLLTCSSSGTEREQIHLKEQLSLPFIYDEEILKLVNKIEANNSKQQDFLGSTTDEINQQLMSAIDDRIFELFRFSKEEKSAIDYALNFTLPLINHKNDNSYEIKNAVGQISNDLTEINGYVKVFIDYFDRIYKKNQLMITVDVVYSEDAVGLFFKISSYDNNIQPISYKKQSTDILVDRLMALGISKITESLFIFKDVRGFEPDGFYIVKRNEAMLWQEYNAYLDLGDFVHAILTAQKDK